MKQWKSAVLTAAVSAAVFGVTEHITAGISAGLPHTAPAGISREEGAILEKEPALTGKEKRLLHELYHYLEADSLRDAAAVLNGHEELLKKLLSETLGGELYLYTEARGEGGETEGTLEKLTEETEGTGLALTRFNTAFFGDFSEGKPNGTVLAIQTIVLDTPRYTYAQGYWEDGKMNGVGVTGYAYYEELPEDSFSSTAKDGIYRDNLLDGTFVYRAEDGNGEALRWRIEADRGVTVIDDRWSYYDFRDEYLLPAEENPDRAYLLAGDRVSMVMWNNLILWPE